MAKRLDEIVESIENSPLLFEQYLSDMFPGKVNALLRNIGRQSRPYIFSGVIRNFFLDIHENRDLDIVVDDCDQLEEFLTGNKYVKNRFGGYKVSVEGTSIDIWSSRDSWVWKKFPLLIDSQSVEKLPETAFFNFSAVLYSLNERKFLYTADFLRFLRDRKIDLVFGPNPDYEMCVINSLYYHDKLELGLSSKLVRYLQSLRELDPQKLQDAQISRYGKEMYTNRQILEKVANL